jgi:NADH-quinone oxidoreductase subunit L
MRKMGGLRKELPITYWTFVVGAVAIAGIPPFAGFFSKDEILYRTYASGHTVLWVVGVLTALLTATYMFRLVFMTFHGERSPLTGASDHATTADVVDHADHVDHKSPGSHLHDAPPAMAVALIVLAIGSVAAGWAGIGGRFEHFLEPSFGAAVGEAVEGGPETTLMIVSVVVALAGIGIAAYFFLVNRRAADQAAAKLSGVHRLLSNKYYVDEVYDAAIVQPIHIVSEDGLWKGVDVGVIDRTVNGVAGAVAGGGAVLRRLQTGSVRAYAASIFLGGVLIIGYFLWL